MTIYDKNGKENGKQTWNITEVKKDGAGYSSAVNYMFVNEKGKEISKGTATYKCNGGVLSADMKMNIPQEQMDTKNMEARVEETYVEYPASMSPGQALKDAEFKMELYNKASLGQTTTFKETGRKVEGTESVTSPAGTWEAYKITYDGQIKTVITIIPIAFNFKATEWFVPGFGLVKSETYSKNGKLIGSTLVTSIKK